MQYSNDDDDVNDNYYYTPRHRRPQHLPVVRATTVCCCFLALISVVQAHTEERFLVQTDDDFATYYSTDPNDAANYNNNNNNRWNTWGWNNGYFRRRSTRVPAATVVPTSLGPTTAVPSPAPTTAAPSPSPTTAAPTAAPTDACVDNSYYRDPVNNLDCYSFTSSSTDCVFVGWVWGGLTRAQVEEVLENCPRSCSAQYDCADTADTGEFTTFTVEAIQFRLVNGVFLGEDSIAALEDATIEYLTRYVRSRGVRSTVVTGATVLYEEKIRSDDDDDDDNEAAAAAAEEEEEAAGGGSADREEEQQAQQQQQPNNNSILQISMSFKGLAIINNNADDMANTMAGYFQQGLLNSAYSRALQYTGDQSFANVYVSFQGTNNNAQQSSSNNNRRSSRNDSQREREQDPNRGSSIPAVAAPILAVSSILLVAATGYALQVMYNMDDDDDDGITETRPKKSRMTGGRKKKKNDKRRTRHDDDRKRPTAAAAAAGGIIDVTQYTYDDDDDESNAYHSFDDAMMLQPPAARYRPGDEMIPSAPTNDTFDSYLDYHEDSAASAYYTRSPSTDDNASYGRQRSTVIPEVTFVDSSSLLEILEYKQQHPYDDVERQQDVIPASDSNISESLKMFVRTVGGTMDAAIQDIQQDRRYYR